MAGFGILTKYLQDEEVEEVNISMRGNCIEGYFYPDKVEMFEETFVSPGDGMDKNQETGFGCGGFG